MSKVDRILSEFIDAWNAGRRPDVDEYASRVSDSCHDQFLADVRTWLTVAPAPAYDDNVLAEIGLDPVLQHALAAGAESPPPWSARLRLARARAGVTLDALGAQVAAAAHLPDERSRAIAYIEHAENGKLEERTVSRRLIEILAIALHVSPEDLAPAWSPAPTTAAVQHLRRDDGTLDEDAVRDVFDALSRAAVSPAPAGPMDGLERLFVGGEYA